jgi:hypothetical protein
VSLATNLAVVASIVFLAVEVRQTGDAVRGATYQQRAMQDEEWGKFLAESDHLRPAITRYQLLASFDSLAPEERERLRDLGLAAAKRLDGVYYQQDLGLLDPEYFKGAFVRQVSIWAPRWVEWGMLDYVLLEVRPSFATYIGGFVDREVIRDYSGN